MLFETTHGATIKLCMCLVAVHETCLLNSMLLLTHIGRLVILDKQEFSHSDDDKCKQAFTVLHCYSVR